MNVLYVCADRGIPVLGSKGASVHVRSLVAAMQRLGHKVTLAARSWEEGNPSPRVHRCERLAKDRGEAAEQLEQMIRAERPDVVIERYSLESDAARLATRRLGIQLTLEVNAPLVAEATRYRSLDDPMAEQREHDTFRTADRIHVVSTALLRYVRSVAPDVPASWIPNGADVSLLRAAVPCELPSMDGRIVVGFIGSMKPWHGVDQLLEAFARIHPHNPQTALMLVGAGPKEAEVIERAGRADMSGHALCTGHVPHAEVPALLSRFDIAVAPYLPVEDFYFHPLKIVEYLAAGKPVVYSDQGDLRALVGRGGLGYRPGSAPHLADRLGQLLADGDQRSELARSAAARGAQLDWSVIAERVLDFATGAADACLGDPLAAVPAPPRIDEPDLAGRAP
jgi:glycosyltransferase involved in cell wall biosynthesis